MSHPDESTPAPLVPTASPEEALVQATPLEASGAPYRVPAPPPLPEPFPLGLYEAPAPRRPRPMLGPALSVFAAMLWTFVVAGQFTTSWMMGAPLAQEIAVVLLMVTTFMAWLTSVRLSRAVVPPRQTTNLIWRAIGIAVLAFLLFVACLFAATFAGNVAADNHDLLIAFVLVVVSLVAAVGGRRLTSPTPPDRTHAQRFMLVMMWIAGTLLTLAAGADLASNG